MSEKIKETSQMSSGSITLSSSSSSSSSSLAAKAIRDGAIAGSGTSLQEAAIGLISGVAFGAVSPIVGHPLDSVKTRMQADAKFQGMTVRQTVFTIYRTEGILGFYRGFVPPLIGSMAFRGLLFSAYSGTYAACRTVPILHDPIPYTAGLRPSVILGAIAASIARATVESPFDYVKVRYMVGQAALINSTSATEAVTRATYPSSTTGMILDTVKSFVQQPVSSVQTLYRGFGATLLRTMGLLGSFFIMADYSVRLMPEVMNAPIIGPFFKGGVCATAAWFFAFPFETAKSVIQTSPKYQGKSTFTVMYQLYQERGMAQGLYRGFGPGASRSFFANGASMMVYAWFQDFIRE